MVISPFWLLHELAFKPPVWSLFDDVGLREPVFLKVRAIANTVDDGKDTRLGQRCQNAVPGAAMEIDRLTGCRQKRAWVGWCASLICRHNHQKRISRHRYKRLTALGMAFHHFQGQGQRFFFALKDADPRLAIRKIQFRKVLKPPAFPLIDDFVWCP